MPNRRTANIAALLVVSVMAVAGCYNGDGYNDYTRGPSAPGGATSVDEYGPGAFSHPARNLSVAEVSRFRIGDTFFTEPWVDAPGETAERDGLGPTYLAASCAGCHIADGRSSSLDNHPDDSIGVLRFTDGHGAQANLDDYREQIQAFGVPGVPAEGSFEVSWVEEAGTYPDGSTYTLRRPVVRATGTYSDISDRSALSPRLAPPLIGLGLLEAIPEEEVVAMADPDDANGDGISGRAHYVTSVGSGTEELGRFGFKANVATVEDQTAIAYLLDIGITSPLFPTENCPSAQVECLAAPSGGEPEIGRERFDDVVFYTQTLAVPSRPFAEDESVVAGSELFEEIGCVACHVAKWETGDHAISAVSGQTIYPYTDLLLHDMGPGLSDGRSDGDATATEWKTPALWGLGLTRTVNSAAGFLHDGRARSIEEAILWHGGEASGARTGFVALSAEDRHLVLVFLKSL